MIIYMFVLNKKNNNKYFFISDTKNKLKLLQNQFVMYYRNPIMSYLD